MAGCRSRGRRGWRQDTWRSGRESIDVEIALPAGSRLDGEAGVAALSCTGRVGELHYKTGQARSASIETGRSRSDGAR